jgi:hypothetical protein
VPLLLGLYLTGFIIVAVRFRRPLLALFWPAAAVFLVIALVVVGMAIGSETRD